MGQAWIGALGVIVAGIATGAVGLWGRRSPAQDPDPTLKWLVSRVGELEEELKDANAKIERLHRR